MKPSIEAKHVLGDKKPHHSVTAARRIGQAFFNDSPYNTKGEETIDSAQFKAYRVMKAVESQIPELSKLKDGRITLVADTGKAEIEAFIEAPTKPEFRKPLQRWVVRITPQTKDAQPTLLEMERFDPYNLHGREKELMVRSLNPEHGDSHFYLSDREQASMYNTATRCLEELGAAQDKGTLEVHMTESKQELSAA